MGLAQILIFRLLPCVALFICLFGIIRRLTILIKAPNPLHLPLTPALKDRKGLWVTLFQDVFILPGLARRSPGRWLLWAGLHLCLLLLFLRHLRMVLDPVPGFIAALEPYSSLAGYLLPLILIIRILGRMISPHMAWISRASDYGAALLLLAAALSGLFLKLGLRADLWAAKSLLMGLWSLDFQARPWPGGSFIAHFVAGLAVIAWLPRSPLNHFLTPFFNPIRRMADNVRQRPHHNPWDFEHADDRVGPLADGDAPPLRTIEDYRMELQAGPVEPDK